MRKSARFGGVARSRCMTLEVQAPTCDAAWDELRRSAVSFDHSGGAPSLCAPSIAEGPAGAVVPVQGVEAIAGALDRMREVCAAVGQMTLRAQLAGATAEDICATLDVVTSAGVRALTALLDT